MAISFFGRNKKDEPGEPTVTALPMTAIVPNRFQPRKVFSAEAIAELAATIEAHGLLQPIVVREYAPNQYEIIAGERRFRALQYLQAETIAAIVQEMTDEESAAMALIENLQREGLSAIEEARAYAGLMRLNQLTQTQLAEGLGKSQSAVANKLRLLKLSDPVQQAILTGELSERHGRELLRVDAYQQQLLLHDILANGMTVKETKVAIDAILTGADEAAPVEKAPKKKRTVHRKSTRDTRLAHNTLMQSIKLIQEAGMQVTVTEDEDEARYRLIVEIPKEKK